MLWKKAWLKKGWWKQKKVFPGQKDSNLQSLDGKRIAYTVVKCLTIRPWPVKIGNVDAYINYSLKKFGFLSENLWYQREFGQDLAHTNSLIRNDIVKKYLVSINSLQSRIYGLRMKLLKLSNFPGWTPSKLVLKLWQVIDSIIIGTKNSGLRKATMNELKPLNTWLSYTAAADITYSDWTLFHNLKQNQILSLQPTPQAWNCATTGLHVILKHHIRL